MREIITSLVQKKVDFLNLKTEKAVNLSSISIKNGVQLVLDNEFVSFKECIAVLEKFRNKGVTFIIVPKSTGFSIGSDSSNERGEIVELSKKYI